MFFEPPPPQESGSTATCPKNPFGHSWKGIARLGDRTQQCCRFCQQTREVRLTAFQHKRSQQPNAAVTARAAADPLAHR